MNFGTQLGGDSTEWLLWAWKSLWRGSGSFEQVDSTHEEHWSSKDQHPHQFHWHLQSLVGSFKTDYCSNGESNQKETSQTQNVNRDWVNGGKHVCWGGGGLVWWSLWFFCSNCSKNLPCVKDQIYTVLLSPLKHVCQICLFPSWG